jgi:hypothetical protein
MAFSEFKNVQQLLKHYPLRIRFEQFLPDVRVEVPAWLVTNLHFSLTRRAASESEMYFREHFIFPFMHLAWQRHPRLKLWSQQALEYDSQLNGEPDFLVSAWTDEPVRELVNKPLLAVAEAKKQDFESGWAQCVAEMLACQKINGDENITVFGIVSTGLSWEFGKLDHDKFIREPEPLGLNDPHRLFGAIDHVFAECEREAFPPAAEN